MMEAARSKLCMTAKLASSCFASCCPLCRRFRPRFGSDRLGVLDECTSAVSVDVEESLYEAAAEEGITCITISQRLALEQFHRSSYRPSLPSRKHTPPPVGALVCGMCAAG